MTTCAYLSAYVSSPPRPLKHMCAAVRGPAIGEMTHIWTIGNGLTAAAGGKKGHQKQQAGQCLENEMQIYVTQTNRQCGCNLFLRISWLRNWPQRGSHHEAFMSDLISVHFPGRLLWSHPRVLLLKNQPEMTFYSCGSSSVALQLFCALLLPKYNTDQLWRTHPARFNSNWTHGSVWQKPLCFPVRWTDVKWELKHYMQLNLSQWRACNWLVYGCITKTCDCRHIVSWLDQNIEEAFTFQTGHSSSPASQSPSSPPSVNLSCTSFSSPSL